MPLRSSGCEGWAAPCERGAGQGGEREWKRTDHLGDDSDVGAERVEVERVGGDAVVIDLALGGDAPQEGEGQGALPLQSALTFNESVYGIPSHFLYVRLKVGWE